MDNLESCIGAKRRPTGYSNMLITMHLHSTKAKFIPKFIPKMEALSFLVVRRRPVQSNAVYSSPSFGIEPLGSMYGVQAH
jgi:hypothetical protein